MTSPTIFDVATEIRRLAAEQPGFAYRPEQGSVSCYYFPDERNPCGCIVGGAMRPLGLDLDDKRFKGLGAESAIRIRFGDLDMPLDDEEDPPVRHALSWINHVQSMQDARNTWGVSVADADDRFGEHAP